VGWGSGRKGQDLPATPAGGLLQAAGRYLPAIVSHTGAAQEDAKYKYTWSSSEAENIKTIVITIIIYLVQRKPNFLQDKNVNLVFSRVHCENIVFPGKTSCFPRMAK
jgi:hypothetical protein